MLAARDRLASGGLVAVPTETVYGLAAKASSDDALKQVFALKGRPYFDPLIVHVRSIGQARALSSDWNFTADFLARWAWPGPLTIVVKKAPGVSNFITAGLDTVAIRWPSHPMLNDLIELLGEPVAAPSANRFGKTSPSRAEHVREEFPDVNLMVLDGGPCSIGVESTVVSAVNPARVEILRPGAVAAEDLRAAFARQSNQIEVIRVDSSGLSPGTLKSHYVPKSPVALVPLEAGSEWIAKRAAAEGLGPRARELALSPDAWLAARELYAEMRRLSDEGADLIWVRRPLEESAGLWSAIDDRLKRAAAYDWRA